MALPIVAVVGRPNVGKSTFVNRIAEADEAIVHEMRGVTRDRSYHKADWNGIEFKLIDTGGIEMGTEDQFQGSIRSQAFEATNEADVIVFIVDGKTGINADDEEVARILRKTSKPVLLAVNKLDTPNKLDELWEFYQLGLGDPFPISATHGHGTGDLLDEVVDHLRKVDCSFEDEEDDGHIINVAIIGRPNAGKSSLTNRLTNNDRSIVSDVAGTTRDAIDTVVVHDGKKYRIVDTAGLRRKSQIDEDVEYYGFVRAMRAIDRADVALLVIDGSIGLTDQDQRVAGFAAERGCAMIIVLNKWDLVEDKSQKAIDTFVNAIRNRMAPFTDFPIVFASALTKQRIFRVLETAKDVYLARTRRVTTAKLNEEMLPLIEAFPPPSVKGKFIKIKYCAQLPDTQIPSFVFYANLPQYIKEPYKRFLENKIRENWHMTGSPINIFIRQK